MEVGIEMKNSKKNIISITMIVLMIFLTGCMFADKNEPEEVDFHTSKRSEESDYCKEILDEVIRCLDEGDRDALIELFSESIKEEYNLAKQIRETLEEYDGKSIAYDVYAYERGSFHVMNGYYVMKYGEVEYRKVIMDSGEEYYIRVFVCLVHDENPQHIGVVRIEIRDANDIGIVIGKIGKFNN